MNCEVTSSALLALNASIKVVMAEQELYLAEVEVPALRPSKYLLEKLEVNDMPTGLNYCIGTRGIVYKH